jgi:hypothetical protein
MNHRDLPPGYLKSCQKFFDSICWPKYYGGGPELNHKIYKLNKPQASSSKQQASSNKQVTSGPEYDIIKTEREKK